MTNNKYLLILVVLICCNFNNINAFKNNNTQLQVINQDATNAVLPDMVFWNIIDKTRKKAKGDFEKQKSLMIDILKNLEPKSIVMFNNKIITLMDAANNEKLYVAFNIAHDNCGEECFEDSRSWLISLGKETFYNVVSEPDNLSDIEFNSKIINGIQHCAEDAYQKISNQEIPVTIKRNINVLNLPGWANDNNLLHKYLPKVCKTFNK